MKVAVIGGYAPSLVNFRGPLLKAMSEAGHEVIALAPEDDDKVRQTLADMGVAFVTTPLQRRGMNPVRDMKSVVDMARQLRAIAPDVVLSYTVKPVVYGSMAARLAEVPHIYSWITGLGYAFGQGLARLPVYLLVKWLYRTGLSVNEAVFFQNPDDKALFQERRIVKSDTPCIVTNGSGVDLEYYAQAPLPEIPAFLCVARLLKEKGVREFVDAARLVKEKYPHVQFYLVGPEDGGAAGVPLSAIREWEQQGNVAIVGAVDDVRPWLRKASVYVLPSYYREGVPRSTLEAMSMGRPVITTDLPGCRETVVSGKNGLLVPAREAETLARAMERFIDEPELAVRMGDASRLLCQQKFAIDQVNATLMRTMGLS